MRRPPPAGTGELAAYAVLAAVGIATLGVWAWGGLAGALLGGGWPHVDLAAALGVATRLPIHLADPRLAWPPTARPALPGPVALYAVLAALGLLAAAGTRSVARSIGSPSWSQGRSGAWARPGELGPLRRGAGRRDAGRLALGRAGGRLLRAEARHALVAFGPPQSGKSAGLAVPALLEWSGPVVASSIKTDLLATSIGRRRSLGPVLVFDPFALGGGPSHTWSPLHGAATWDGALEVAWRLASAGELDQRGVEGGDFWAVAAEQRLAPLLFAASASDGGMESVVRWAYGQDSGGLHRVLAELTGSARDESSLAGAFAAYDANRGFEAQADRTRASIEGTVQALLRAYRFTRVIRSAAGSEITARRLLEERATLYLIGDAKASKLLRPIFVALISEIVDHAYETATRRGGRLEAPLLLCLDEAGNVAPLPNLAEIASTAPSHNIQIVSIFHDLTQARSRYGGQAETVVNSHRARMLLPGVADLETLRFFSGLAGEADVREVSHTIGDGGRTRSVGRRARPLISPEALRQLPQGSALLLYGRLPPVRLRLRLWFADRRLRRLAGAGSGPRDRGRAPDPSHPPTDPTDPED